MMNRILRFSLPILLTITTGSVSWAQLGTFDDLRLKGPAPNIVFAPADNDSDRFRILARSGGESLDIDRPGLDCVVRIFRDANAEALLIDGNGVRINETFSLGSATPLLEFNDGVDTWALGIDSGQFSIRAANGNDLLVLQNDRVVANQTIRVSDAQPRYQFDRNGLVWDLEVDETNILNIDSPTDFNISKLTARRRLTVSISANSVSGSVPTLRRSRASTFVRKILGPFRTRRWSSKTRNPTMPPASNSDSKTTALPDSPWKIPTWV